MTIKGTNVTLRPYRSEEEETILSGTSRLSLDVQPLGPPDRAIVQQRIADSGHFANGRLDLGIDLNGRLIGDVVAMKNPFMGLPRGVYMVGIVIFSPKDRGHGYGRDALGALIDWLFTEEGARSVVGGTTQDNVAALHLLAGFGFRSQGPYIEHFENGDREYIKYSVASKEWMENKRS